MKIHEENSKAWDLLIIISTNILLGWSGSVVIIHMMYGKV